MKKSHEDCRLVVKLEEKDRKKQLQKTFVKTQEVPNLNSKHNEILNLNLFFLDICFEVIL